jgi:hypothetical protein
MPNGGVPLHLILTPKTNPNHVVHIKGTTLNVYDKEDFESNGHTKAVAILTLNDNETLCICEFLNHWFYKADLSRCEYKGVNVDYDH